MTKPKSKPKAATRSTARKAAKPASRKRSASASSKPASAARHQTSSRHRDAAERPPAQRSLRSWRQRIGSSIRCAAFSPVSSARSSVSIWFQSRPIRGASIASRTARLRPRPQTEPSRRRDAMQKQTSQWSCIDQNIRRGRDRAFARSRSPRASFALAERLSEVSPRPSDAASVVCGHRLSPSG